MRSFLARVVKPNQSVFLAYGIGLFLLLAVSILKPGYASESHLRVVAIDCAILGIAAVGQTFVILTGGLDLSVPWVFTSSAFYLSMFCGGNNSTLVLAIPAVLLISTFMGMLNGAGVAYLGISPVIMTLGANTIFQGVLVGITGGRPQGQLPEAMQSVTKGSILGLPNLVIIWVLVAAAATVALSKLPLGRKVLAIGNSEKVSVFSGINVKRIKMGMYAISGFSAGLAGILFASRLGQLYLGMGDPYQMTSIAVVAVGGTSLIGGKGSYLGTIAGTLTIIVLTGLLAAFSLPASVQQIIYGVVIFVAVLFARGKIAER
jgi:ribose transport system permease protein